MPKHNKPKVGKDDDLAVVETLSTTAAPQGVVETVKQEESSCSNEQGKNETIANQDKQQEQDANEEEKEEEATTNKQDVKQEDDAKNDKDKTESNDDEDDEAQEAWDLKKVLTISDVKNDCILCETDGCGLLAAVVYVSTGKPPQKWRGCLDCQVRAWIIGVAAKLLF